MQITTTVRRGVAAAALLAVATPALAACGDDPGEEAEGPVTVTETVTVDPPETGATASAPTDDGTGAPGTGTTSGAATSDLPTDAQGYAQALVDAWQAGDRDRALELVRDPDDADELLDDDLVGPPTFVACEGAAGSSYCTWTGTGYEIVVQVGNEAASAGQPGAISDVEVDD